MNIVLIRPILKQTPYKIYKGRKSNISHFHVFGCKCFVFNNGKDTLGKFDAKDDEGIFLRYSTSSKAFRIYNKRIITNATKPKNVVEDGDDLAEILENSLQEDKEKGKEDNEQAPHQHLPREWISSKNHPLDNIIGDI